MLIKHFNGHVVKFSASAEQRMARWRFGFSNKRVERSFGSKRDTVLSVERSTEASFNEPAISRNPSRLSGKRITSHHALN
jgi:hypothetical protein